MATVNSRASLKEWCLRSLGKPVLEVNVTDEQIDDRTDEALEFLQEFNSDLTLRTFLKHEVTATDVTNEYITLDPGIIFLTHVFPIRTAGANGSGLFDIQYQFMVNNIRDLTGYGSGLAYYEQMQQYVSMLQMKLSGTPQVTFTRSQNRLYIHGDFADQDLVAGDYIVAEVYAIVDPEAHVTVYNNIYLKKYLTALIKRQWGANLMKFEGIQLPGGIMLNGRQMFDDATAEIAEIEEKIRLEQEMPTDFMIG